MTDLVDRIDALINPACQQCGGDLGASVSDDFCSDTCQQAWHAARVDPLVGYEEPSDLPAHVSNQVESSSPETTPAPRFVVTHHPGAQVAGMPSYIQERYGRVPAGTPPVTIDTVRDMYTEARRRDEPIDMWRFTHAQWFELIGSMPMHAEGPNTPDSRRLTPEDTLFGLPIQLVDDLQESTAYRWLGRRTLPRTLLPPLFLLAGSVHEARGVATVDLNLPPLSWHCVRDDRDPRLLGVSDRWRYRIVGTFWERADAEAIFAAVTSRRLREVSPDDLAALAQRPPASTESQLDALRYAVNALRRR